MRDSRELPFLSLSVARGEHHVHLWCAWKRCLATTYTDEVGDSTKFKIFKQEGKKKKEKKRRRSTRDPPEHATNNLARNHERKPALLVLNAFNLIMGDVLEFIRHLYALLYFWV